MTTGLKGSSESPKSNASHEKAVAQAMVGLPHDEPRALYLSGIGMLLLGTVAFSSAGLFVRLIGRDAATLLFWRGLFTASAILLFLLWRHGLSAFGQFRSIGWPGLQVASLSTVSMACFLVSLQYTTVANNSIIFGTAPFMTAALAWLLIRERPSVPTMACSTVALMGAVMVVGSSAHLSAASLVGDALAALMTLAFAVKTVLVRQHHQRPMIAAGCVGALLGSAAAVPFVPSWSISLRELGYFALFGFTQQGAGLILTTIGLAHVPAAHAALIMALDLPLSPVWVWLLFGEQPTRLALAGGLLVFVAIVAHIAIEGWRRRQS